MTPHRAQSFAGQTVESIRGISTAPVETWSAVGTAVVAAVGWAFGPANTTLLAIVGAAMLLDLVVGSLHAVVSPLIKFDRSLLYAGMIGKLFRAMLIPTASLVDWLYIESPLPLPGGYEQAFPVTSAVMIALAAAELTSVANHFRDGGVAPGPIAAIVRHLDRIRLGGADPPARRHYDVPAIVAEHELPPHRPQEEETDGR